MAHILPLDAYLAQPRGVEAWWLKSFFPVGGTMLVHGGPKTGKSYLMLQLCAALQHGGTFLGFEATGGATILYVQLDTPDSLWIGRIEKILHSGFDLGQHLWFADRKTLDTWPFDILNDTHQSQLRRIVDDLRPDVVIIDTIRAAHSGEENDSAVMQTVVNRFTAAIQPAAAIFVAHSKKPSYEGGPDPIHDNRGSSALTGAVDAVLQVNKRSIHYVGRELEEGSLKARRAENGLWETDQEDMDVMIAEILADTTLTSMRAKAKALSDKTGKSEEACRSLLRRLE